MTVLDLKALKFSNGNNSVEGRQICVTVLVLARQRNKIQTSMYGTSVRI